MSTANIKKKWKDHLLRSGVPLEYEVARVLAEQELSVYADFCFLHRDPFGATEWSVDIQSDWDCLSSDHNFSLHLLLECKYRSPEKLIIFFNDPNSLVSPAVMGGTVNCIDEFAPFKLSTEAFSNLEQSYEFVYKGIELHGGGAVETDLRHGINQLRYATPAYLCDWFDFLIGGHPEDLAGIMFSKILVTNAPMKILENGIDIEAIRNADDIADISREVDTVILFSDYGPAYRHHFQSIFEEDLDSRIQGAKKTSKDLENIGKKLDRFNNPREFISNLAAGAKFEIRPLSTQFFITTLHALPNLIQEIKAACLDSYESRVIPKSTKNKRKRKTARRGNRQRKS